jgi:hypothetical protein
MKRASTHRCLRWPPLLRSRAPLALALGLLSLVAWAAAPRTGDSLSAERFSRACAALDAGELDSAAQDIRALREAAPELPEGRLLESLLTLRRERPSLGGFDAFLQAWNDLGRPDFSGSRLLPVESSAASQETGLRAGSTETELILTLAMPPEAKRARLILQHLRELDPPELIFAADDRLQNESLPSVLRTQASQALHTRLSELTLASPHAMQYPALLLVDGSSPDAPFTPEDLQAIEAIAALPDWRESDFHTIYQRVLRQFEAAGQSQPAQAAFMLAVESLATEPAYLLFKRTEASRETLSPAELRRLGEALWRIGSHMAEESTLLERMLGTRLMKDGASLLQDEVRAQQASVLREEGAAASKAMSQAAPSRWPLRSLREAFLDAMLRDEMGCMLRFLPPTSHRGDAP